MCTKCGGPKPPGRGRRLCENCQVKCDDCAAYRNGCAACRRALLESEPERRAKWNAANYRARLKKDYGINDAEVDALLSIESCEICGSSDDLIVDHNHKTMKVRGRICKACNSTLGLAGDSIARLRAMADYLEERGSYED